MQTKNDALPSYTLRGGVVSSDVWNRLQRMVYDLRNNRICDLYLTGWVIYPAMLPIYRYSDAPFDLEEPAFKVIDCQNGEHVANLRNCWERIGCLEVINPFGKNIYWKFPWVVERDNHQMDSFEGLQPQYRIRVVDGPQPKNQLQDCLRRIALQQDGCTLASDKERLEWVKAWRRTLTETNEAFPRCQPERLNESTLNHHLGIGEHGGGWRASLLVEPIKYRFPSFLPQRVKNS